MTIPTCNGFSAAGIAAGLKKDGLKDLGLICSGVPANVAGVFTNNLVKAAPVILDMERIKSGVCRALIANSGNANCCNGEQGMADAAAMSKFAADCLDVPDETVLVASTGVIGETMPIEKIGTAAPKLAESLKPEGFGDFAEAIMTTDTVPKIVTSQCDCGGKSFTVLGVAKGAGMIRPDMATMLCFVCSDIEASPEILKQALAESVDKSFNRITVDGDTSTNDTVLLMANGLSGVSADTSGIREKFQKTLDDVLVELAKMCVKDGEGATKLVEINVNGAASDSEAFKVADTTANSPLVKTALFGEDANWGRIMCAVGRAGIPVDHDKIDIFFDSVQMVRSGLGCGAEVEAEAAKVLKKPEFEIRIDLNAGDGTASVFTCDFSLDYVRINADYRS